MADDDEAKMLQWMQGEWSAGRLTRPQDAMVNLLRQPEEFLRKNPILNTFDCARHGQTRAYFRNGGTDAKRPGSRLGTLNFHATESFNLEQISGANRLGYAFPVHGVFTSQSNAAPNWYRLDTSGPALMLTAKLTGCTFVARSAGAGAIEVTHLQPNQEDGLALNKRMTGGGNAAYGRLKYDFDTRSINVIGIRHGNVWKIWAQKLQKNGHTTTLLSMNRIWPV